MAKKFKVVGSFVYRGADGKETDKVFTISPGEDCPKLDSNEKERLLRLGKVAEVSENGEVIIHQNPEDLKDDQIKNLMLKNPAFITSFLFARQSSSFPLSKETLSKMYSLADERKMPKDLIEKLEEFIAA